MKIMYDSLSLYDVKQRLEKISTSINCESIGRGITIKNKDGQLFLEINEGRLSTQYKIVLNDNYVQLKYSGFFSYLNIILAIVWGILPMLLAMYMGVYMLITKNIDTDSVTSMLAGVVVSIGFLWILIIDHRIMAKKYIKKLIAL